MSGLHTTWLREDRTVYALQPAGYRKGVEQFQNRWSFHVQGGVGSTPDELERVALLAAAAPALLEAAKVAEDLIDDMTTPGQEHEDPELYAALKALRAAITAATQPAQAPVEEE